MKALGGSYLRVFVSREREKERAAKYCCPDFARRRGVFGFHANQKRVVNGPVLFRAKCVGSVSTAALIQNNLENEEIQTLNSDQPNSVRVRFKLHKECAFGQHFLVVGDDPNLGLWDPSEGVALDWSEGHVWTAEVDVPSNKVINFKFILKELSGALHWQPGPDRVLETWDTAKTISVSEDWDSPELQNVVEEEPIVVDDVDDGNESSLENSVSLIGENWNQIVVEEWDDVMKEEDEVMNGNSDNPSSIEENIQDLSLRDEGSDPMSVAEKGMMVVNGSDSSSLKHETGPSVDEGVPVLVPGLGTVPHMVVTNGSETSSLKNERGPSVDDGVPVLVPGLGTVPHEEFELEELKMEEEESSSMVECDENLEVITTTSVDEFEDPIDLNKKSNNFVENLEVITTTSFDEFEDPSDLNKKSNNFVEDNDESAVASVHRAEASEVVVEEEEEEEEEVVEEEEEEEEVVEEEERRFNGEEKMGRNIIESNMQWGRQRLRKFLANLGFMRHN